MSKDIAFARCPAKRVSVTALPDQQCAIAVGSFGSRPLKLLEKHVEALVAVFTAATVYLGAATVFGLLALFLDRDRAPVPWLFYAVVLWLLSRPPRLLDACGCHTTSFPSSALHPRPDRAARNAKARRPVLSADHPSPHNRPASPGRCQ